MYLFGRIAEPDSVLRDRAQETIDFWQRKRHSMVSTWVEVAAVQYLLGVHTRPMLTRPTKVVASGVAAVTSFDCTYFVAGFLVWYRNMCFLRLSVYFS